ncbi:MAG: 1-acyl-sn-glycerol-3-phosphate acyltransferase [Leptothrix sp. (in: Bacteria)]|nr:1-acyl-sn-glycerol-3-phosphate acyltransferase [Leptothrix sp. (in: b-proteobacteria)]
MSRAWSTWVLGPWRLFCIVVHIVRGLWLARIAYVDRPKGERDEVVRRWSQQLLKVLGVKLVVHGQARPGAKLVVSNHVSWLDIVAINSVVPSRFVSKAEVAGWPVVGYMVTAAGTLYLQRERRRDAMRVLGLMSDALREGYTVAVFPEGTTGDGQALMHFHANMLQAAIDAKEPVQPVALRYSDATHDISSIAAFVGDTTLWQSLWGVITAQGLTVHVNVLPLQAVDHADRRALAELLSTRIADCLY